MRAVARGAEIETTNSRRDLLFPTIGRTIAMNKDVLFAAALFVLAAAAHSQPDGTAVPTERGQVVPEAPSPSADRDRRSSQPVRTMQRSVIVRGTVEGIDPQNRLFALQGPGGKTAIISADENLQNFEKLKLGEPATVRYTEAAVLAISRKGVFGQQKARYQSQRAAGLSSELSSDSPQQRIGPRTSMFGKVTDIDLPNGNITIENDEGQRIEMHAADDEAISRIYVGERILVTYAEAIAITVQPD